MFAANLFEAADVDFSDQLKPTFGWLFEAGSEHIPMFNEGNNREAGD
ncbi:MAG: hypothetical protein WCE51_08415 [Chthoniobacterales bacterium]